MTDKKIKKLKRKVWLISTSVLLIYLALLIAKPSVWPGLVPIIIPASGLTIGIPVFNYLKCNNIKKGKIVRTQEYIKDVINNQAIKKNEINNSYEKELMFEDNTDVTVKIDKPKVKRKGTIN